MKIINILFLLLFPTVVFSSTNDTTITPPVDSLKAKKILIGIQGSPDYCFRKLKSDADSKWIADSRDSIEIPKIGYSVGAGMQYNINKKIQVEVGVLFSDKGEKTKKAAVQNVPYGQEPAKFSYNFHYYYLDIPIKANYFLLTGKFKLYVTAGASANIFLNQKTTFITNYKSNESKTTSKINSGFSRVNMAVLVGCGISYPINPKTWLRIEPIYTRSFTSIISAPIKSYLYSAGLNIGIYYHL